MNILSWNCRGTGGRATIPTLKRYLQSTRAHLAFVSETKCNTTQAMNRIAHLPLPHSEIIPSSGKSGGLWLLWSDDIRLSILEKSFYFIFVRIENVLGSWILGLVYGDPHHYVSDYIWERILFYSRSSLPLCLVGDFNSVLTKSEKFGGSQKTASHVHSFQRMVQTAGVLDLGYKGPAFTWSNNQPLSTLIMQRLDRALASVTWLTQFPSAAVYHLPRFNSDHHPILLRTNPPPPKNTKTFRIENWWFQHPEFSGICNQITVPEGTNWMGAVHSIRVRISK